MQRRAPCAAHSSDACKYVAAFGVATPVSTFPSLEQIEAKHVPELVSKLQQRIAAKATSDKVSRHDELKSPQPSTAYTEGAETIPVAMTLPFEIG